MNTGYATINTKTNKLQGIDISGGGYPFDTNDIQQVKIWPSREKALEYLNTGLRREGLALCVITLNYVCQIVED